MIKRVFLFIISLIYTVVFLNQVHAKPVSLPNGESIPFHHVSVDQGLSQVTVNDISQDKNGFLWFATEDGLNRYDGKDFIVYHSDAEKDLKINGNIINFVVNDSANRLWIGMNGQGIEVKINSQFKTVPITINGQLANNIIATILFEDSNKQLWLGTWADGLFKYSEEKNQFFRIYSSKKYNRIWSISELGEELLIAVDKNGIAVLKNNKPVPWSASAVLNNSTVKALLQDGKMLWIGSDGRGLWQYDISMATKVSQVIGNTDLARAVVHKLYKDQTGTLWVGTAGSGFFKKEKNNNWMHQVVGNEKDSLSNNRVLSLFQDRSGVFWIGTEGAGLNYFDPYSLLFRNIRQGNNRKQNLNDKMVYAISSDRKDNWWFGTESGGVNRWDKSTQRFYYYSVNSGHLDNNTVRTLQATKQGMLVGTLNGFSLISLTGKLLNRWRMDNLPGLTNNIILSFEKAGENKVWIGTYNGLFLFDLKNKAIIKSFLDEPQGGPFSTKRAIILSLHQTKESLWVGTLSDGIYRYDFKHKLWKNFKHKNINTKSLGSNAIYTIFEDSNHIIWVGTKGAGLQKYNPKDETFEQYDKRNGLANNVVYGILEDNRHNLWLSTNAGISEFNVRKKTFTNFTKEDGLQGREFNAGAFFHAKDILAFGGINGISWFNETDEISNKFQPETQITTVRVFNRELSNFATSAVKLTNIAGLPSFLELDYDKSMFTIDFAALHFSAPQKNKYQYRLLGLGDEWISVNGGISEATYTGLPSGSYQFQVKSITPFNRVDSSPAILNVKINPPPWKTWWAYLIYVLLVLLSFWQYFNYLQRKLASQKKINNSLRKIDQLKERLAETERMAILGELSSNIAHSLRNPLASIRTSAELIEDDALVSEPLAEDAKNIISEVDRLSIWIKELLEYSKNQKANMESIDISKTCQNILNSYQAKFQINAIECSFSSQSINTPVTFDPLLFQHMLNSLLDNAIEAIKDGGKISVTIEENERGKIELSLADSGEGIAFEHQTHIFNSSYTTKVKGLGMGLSLVKRIVERHDAEINVTSEAAQGTTFKIIFGKNSG